MSSLDLKLEDPPGHALTDKTFRLLRDFLQPDTVLTMESTAESILELLPENAPLSTDIWSFGETCIELAEQIPYYHPSQLKLAALFEHLGQSAKLGQTCKFKEMSSGQYVRYQRLGESLKESFSGPDPENPSAYINFHAFVANLHERRIFRTDHTWAIWAQRDALENPQEDQGVIRDAYVLAAAQWILWYGQSLFKQVLSHGEVSPKDLQYWKPGPLYNGKADLSLHRWHFWRDAFAAVASSETIEEKGGYGQECKNVSAKVAAMMDSLEQNMTF
ncbi:MAG: hypothetical protein M1819_000730 [Sarea resinae]|nr:MAG: hypothetical protein M1819_000730 [Sarea resinae]